MRCASYVEYERKYAIKVQSGNRAIVGRTVGAPLLVTTTSPKASQSVPHREPAVRG